MPIQIADKKRFFLFAGTIIVLLAISVFLGMRLFQRYAREKEPPETPAVYEAMIQTKGEDRYESEADRKTFFENGDVLVIFPAGHAWTTAEKEELIVKLEIKKEDADKLMESETKTADGRAGQETETVRLRKYQIDLGDVDKNNPEKVYGEKVIEEK